MRILGEPWHGTLERRAGAEKGSPYCLNSPTPLPSAPCASPNLIPISTSSRPKSSTSSARSRPNASKPVMLYSIGKDSAVMLHLALQGLPSRQLPFPLLHVDTTWKFRDMIAFRDRHGARARARSHRPRQPGRAQKRHQSVRPRLGPPHRRHEDRGAEAGAGQIGLRCGLRRGPPRRGEIARQGAHLLVSRAPTTAGTRRTSAPSCGASTMPARTRARSIRVFPLSNWTELDMWQYIHREDIPIVPLYFAASGRWCCATAS